MAPVDESSICTTIASIRVGYSPAIRNHRDRYIMVSTHRRRLRLLSVMLLIAIQSSCHAFPLHPYWRPAAPLPSMAHSVSAASTGYYRLQSPYHATATADTEETSYSTLQISNASSRLDPLLTSFLLRSIRNSKNADGDDSGVDQSNSDFEAGTHFTFSDASQAMIGLQTWEASLRKARLPLPEDFQNNFQNTNSNERESLSLVWPEEPLFTRVEDALTELGLPRLVRRHPEIVTSVLLGVAKIVIDFIVAQRRGKLVLVEENEEYEEYDEFEDDGVNLDEFEYESISAEELDSLADSLADSLRQEWGGVVRGVSQLDKVFGYDHGMLDMQGQDGFGIQDGIWQHSGWKPMPDLQRRISSMPELRDLLARLGRRPSAEGKDTRKFRARKRSYSKDDMMGVEMDPLDPTSVSGLALSGSIASMLPSEAVLLRSSLKSLRWLFLAKKAESKLLSYELSGYTDVPTKPLPQTRRSVHLPSAPGGPLIICLDTSHSMTGTREVLSKAVVLATVTAAHKQGRECQVVSFSSANNAIESGIISCDAEGIRKLLDFLSYSFGGGTDVCGALKFAMEALENDMASSDLLLVTDGELPNPPVSNLVLAKLEGLKERTGMEVHGLLVGKRESESLNLLCTEVHDFLSEYDGINGVTASFPLTGTSPRLSTTSLSLLSRKRSMLTTRFGRRQIDNNSFRFALYATSKYNDETMNVKLNRKGDRRTKRRFDDDDDDSWEFDDMDDMEYSDRVGSSAKPSDIDNNSQGEPKEAKSEFVQQVEKAIKLLQGAASESIEKNNLLRPDLEVTWSKGKVISDTISFVEEGLVERDLEARLVVLGMVSQEHVLFIGPPGTSKSEIGRRLSQLCGGPFFQRLFTRFTTPEEIFGPLSLRALENDEYVRCIDGFLPTATVAFLDEIFKANSAILNTLLTILNERKFDNGAGTRVSCPLKCVIGASNELPDSEELDALLDRFLLRSYVSSVSDDGLMEILSAKTGHTDVHGIDSGISATLDEVIVDISTALDEVSIGQNVCILIRDLRNFVRDELGIYISDRRLVKAARLLKVSAASHGRKSVDFVDCLLLQHVLWQLPEHRDAIREFLYDNMTPGNTSDDVVNQTKFLLEGLVSEASAIIKKTMGDITGEFGARAPDLETICSIQNELKQLENLMQQNTNELERHMELLSDLANHLWIGSDEAHAAKQHLLPLAQEVSAAVNEALMSTTLLKLALSSDIIENDLRSSVIETLTDQDADDSIFTEEELQMSLKEAKRRFNGNELRKWKSARKELV